MERARCHTWLIRRRFAATLSLVLVLAWCEAAVSDDRDSASVPIGSEELVDPQTNVPDDRGASVPIGFEELVEPQTNIVDVYYNGLRVAEAIATYSPGTIEIHDPAQIVAEMADLADRAMVLGALTGELPTNASLVCLDGEANDDTGCGILSPNVAGVIFDQNNFRVDVFVAGAYRQVLFDYAPRYLHPSDGDPAVISYVTGIVSGGDDQDTDYDVLNRTILGYMDNRAVFDLVYGSDDGVFLDEGRFIAEREALRYEAGLFRTAPLEAVAQEKIVGVSIGTQLDSRLGLDLISGTPLIIFLPVRSKVDIFGNGRLLSSATYDAGNQTLNTASLPPGSYEVTLRITEIGGGSREETRFFAKTPELPPGDAPVYVLQIGQMVDDDFRGRGEPVIGTLTDTTLLRAGTIHRLDDQTGWFADAMGSDTQLLLQTGGVFLDVPLRLQAGVVGTTDADFGYFLRYSDHFDAYSLNLSMRQIFAGDTAQTRDGDIFDPFIDSSQQFSGSVTYRLPDTPASVSMIGSFSREADVESWSFGPQFSALVYSGDGMNLNWTGSATQSDREFLAISQLRLTYIEDNWTYEANLAYRHADPQPGNTSDGGSGPEGSAVIAWEDLDTFEDDLAFRAGAVHNVNEDSVFAGGDYATDIGRVGFDYETNFRDGDNFTTYSGLFDINLVGNPDGFAFGGPGMPESGVIVLLDGNVSADREFSVKVNGESFGLVDVGGSLFLPLPPYETYDIMVVGDETGFVHLDYTHQTVTLFPGNAVSLNFVANHLVPVFGQIVDAQGDPIANAKIDGTIGVASSDEFGYFQGEVTTARKLEVQSGDGQVCAVALPETLPGDVYADLGVLTCTAIPDGA